MIDPDHAVSCRTLTLEHAHDRSTSLLEELTSPCIREAPQLPVVRQISRPLRSPHSKQEIQVPGLLEVLQVPVAHIAGEAVHVKRKPFQKLIASRTCGSHEISEVRFAECIRLVNLRKRKFREACEDFVEMWSAL